METESSLEDRWSSIDGPISRQVTAIVIGAGERGNTYASFARDFPSRLKIVAVAEPVLHRRRKFQAIFNIEPDRAVPDWKDLASVNEKLADVAIITTQDQMHRDPAIAFANLGYHLLLEKPMAITERDCIDIASACERNDTIVAVCHVLRYFPPCIKLKEIVDSGILGDIVTINHRENILFWHFAHSFVRGNWRNQSTSTFSLLAKCCHDIDLLQYWMGSSKCTRVQSFGGLYHFQPSQKPRDAADRCFDCPKKIERSCPFSAQKIYLEANKGYAHWPMSVVVGDVEDHPGGYQAALHEELRTGPYGRCVYKCDNDVCDHQTVNLEYDSGATAIMTMNAFTKDMRRETRICGTRGEVRWDGSASNPLLVYNFGTQTETEIHPDATAPEGCRTAGGHGGADFFLMNSFTKAVSTGDKSGLWSCIEDSSRSHKLVFAAGRSRLNGTIESVDI